MHIVTEEGKKRAMELLRHFKAYGVSHDPKGGNGLKLVLEWQDLIGRSSMEQITVFEEGLTEISNDGADRDTFLFVNMHALSYHLAIDIFKHTHGNRLHDDIELRVRAELNDFAEDLNDRETALKKEQAKVEAGQNAVLNNQKLWFQQLEATQKVAAAAQRQCDDLKRKIEELGKQLETERKFAEDMNEAAENWNDLKNLVKELLK